jgi:hypothetical protein
MEYVFILAHLVITGYLLNSLQDTKGHSKASVVIGIVAYLANLYMAMHYIQKVLG